MKAREKTTLAVASALTVEALEPRHWADLERLFGANGACAGCWCMFWRLALPAAGPHG